MAWTRTFTFKTFNKLALTLKRKMEYGCMLYGRQSEMPTQFIFTLKRRDSETLLEGLSFSSNQGEVFLRTPHTYYGRRNPFST